MFLVFLQTQWWLQNHKTFFGNIHRSWESKFGTGYLPATISMKNMEITQYWLSKTCNKLRHWLLMHFYTFNFVRDDYCNEGENTNKFVKVQNSWTYKHFKILRFLHLPGSLESFFNRTADYLFSHGWTRNFEFLKTISMWKIIRWTEKLENVRLYETIDSIGHFVYPHVIIKISHQNFRRDGAILIWEI